MGLTAEINRLRRIGAEFEMTVPLVGTGTGRDVQATLAAVLSANGVRAICRGYDSSPLPPGVDVAVEYDSSISGESRWAGITWMPIECKTRIIDGLADYDNLVPRLLEICRYMGARVNASTGHHLHLAFEEVKQNPRVVRSLHNAWHRFQAPIFGLVAPSRRHSTYCRPLPPGSAKLLHGCRTALCFQAALRGASRYDALNLTHLWDQHPRLEVRLHQGTLCPKKARAWLAFCLQCVQHAVTRNCQATETPVPNDRAGVEKLLVTAGYKVNSRVYAQVCPELRACGRFMLRRWKSFNGNIALRGTAEHTRPPTSADETEVE